MDGNIRKNARTSIGDMVSIIKAEVKPAKKVVIAPANKGVMIKASSKLFKQGLLVKAVFKGDIVSLGTSRRRITPQGRDVNDIFSMMESQFAVFGFGDLKFIVVDTDPRKLPVVITQDTEVEFNPQAVELKDEDGLSLGINYEDIGGLGEEITKVREMIELPLKHPEIFEKLGIEPPKGVLLHGAPGTGNTLLAKAVANESEANFILLNGPEIMCVSGDTQIFTNPHGYIKAEEIYQKEGKNEEIKNYSVKKLTNPISTYSFKEDKIEKSHITHVTKLNSNCFKIKINDGNEITASENQPFLVYKN